MIVAQRKPLQKILVKVREADRLLVVGCQTCVAVCLAGGEREVATVSSAIRLALRGRERPIEVVERSVERQCEEEFNEPLAEEIARADAVLSMACGVGVQTLVEQFPDASVYPGLDTSFMGRPEEQGVWSERCYGCGDCVLDQFGGICPIARCSKNLLNGPCGGSQDGRCEVDPENIECAWQLIYDRLSRLGQLDRLLEIQPPKDWRPSHHGGWRKLVRKDMML